MLTKGGVSQIRVIVLLLLVYHTVGTYGQTNDSDVDTTLTTSDDLIPTLTTEVTANKDNSSTLHTASGSLTSTTTSKSVEPVSISEGEPRDKDKSTTVSDTNRSSTNSSFSSTGIPRSEGETTNRMLSSSMHFVSMASTVVSSKSLPTAGNASIPTNTTSAPDTNRLTPGLTIGIVIGLLGLVTIVVFISFKLMWRKKSYRTCTLQCCYRCFKFKRLRSSSTGSHGPLTPDDATSVDIPATNRDEELFSIGDQDGGHDGRPSFSRHDSDDDYFYDEIFDRSAFQDRKTIQSNKHLTLSGDEEMDDFDGEFDIPDLVFKKPFSRI